MIYLYDLPVQAVWYKETKKDKRTIMKQALEENQTNLARYISSSD